MNQNERLSSLTSLKGLFITIIVFHNTFSVIPLFDAVPGISFLTRYGGTLGNSMFLMLSGFLLSYGYQDRICNHQIPFKSFLFRRLRKLYPLFLVTNAFALLIDIFRYGPSAVVLDKIALSLLLQAGVGLYGGNPYNSPTWFLSVLLICYLLFFFICWLSKSSTQRWCMTLAMVAIGCFLSDANLSIPFLFNGSGLGYMNFFLGCAFANLYSIIPAHCHKWAKKVAFAALCVSFWLMFRYGIDIISGNFAHASAFLLVPLILYLSRTDGLCRRILQWKPLIRYGSISTQLFFWHLPVFYFFCDLYSAVFPGTSIKEPHYLVYLAVLIAWCFLFPKLTKDRF